jgi:hypothetical protein
MGKGNHVFNNFDGAVYNAFGKITEALGLGREFDALGGSGGNVDAARKAIDGTFQDSYKFLREILDHPLTKQLHQVQDDEPVLPNDPNSQAFGQEAALFTQAALKWVWGDPAANPAENWRRMVNLGHDAQAQTNYIEKCGETAKKSERRDKCQDLAKFVKGELTKLVRNWLLALRLDLLKAKKVQYDDKPLDWKNLLETALAAE